MPFACTGSALLAPAGIPHEDKGTVAFGELSSCCTYPKGLLHIQILNRSLKLLACGPDAAKIIAEITRTNLSRVARAGIFFKPQYTLRHQNLHLGLDGAALGILPCVLPADPPLPLALPCLCCACGMFSCCGCSTGGGSCSGKGSFVMGSRSPAGMHR